METLEGSAVHSINLAYGLGGLDTESHLWSPLLAVAQAEKGPVSARRGRLLSSFLEPAWVRERERKRVKRWQV